MSVDTSSKNFPTVFDGSLVDNAPKKDNLKNILINRGCDPRFAETIIEIVNMHIDKGKDYGEEGDHFKNVRGSNEWGIPGTNVRVPNWLGVMIRAYDKVRRLQQYSRNGNLANEGAKDAFLDLANYSMIAKILWEEENEQGR